MFACFQCGRGSRVNFGDYLLHADHCRGAALGALREGDKRFFDCARDGGVCLVCGPSVWKRVDPVLSGFSDKVSNGRSGRPLVAFVATSQRG
jgi:hypothetical protein